MLCDNLDWGMRWEMRGGFKGEWLIHVDVWQKPTQYCKAIKLQKKKKSQNKKINKGEHEFALTR